MEYQRAYQALIITIFASLLGVNCETNNPVCLPLWYRKRFIRDKPDLLIVQNLRKPSDADYWWGICKFDSSSDRATQVATPSSFYGNQFQYNSRNGTLYKGDVNSIKRILLKNGKEKIVWSVKSNTSSLIGPIALDWISQNMYFHLNGSIGVINLKDTSKPVKTIFHFGEKLINPKMVVHPNKGYLYIKITPHKLIRLNLFGRDYKEICNYRETPTINIETIAMDYHEDKLYWLETKKSDRVDETQIKYSDLNGDDVQTLSLENNDVHHWPSIALDKNYVYYVQMVAMEHHSIFRIGKVDGAFDPDFEIVDADPHYGAGVVEDIVVLNQPQEISRDHPCRVSNGGCLDYCFAIPEEDNGLTKICA